MAPQLRLLTALGRPCRYPKVLLHCLHPNAGAVLVLSLGCENNQPDDFMKMLGDYDHDRIKLLVTQKVEGDELEEGMKILRNLYAKAKEDKREEVPVSKLRVGLKCGGSDGFSGSLPTHW